jgi:DNA-binding transcriptional LysR family regulator
MLPRFIGAQDARLMPVLTDEITLTRSFWLVVHRDTRKLARVAAFVDWLVALVESQAAIFRSPASPHS